MKSLIFTFFLLITSEIHCLKTINGTDSRDVRSKDTLNLDNLYCQKITAYYNGTFKDPKSSLSGFDVEIQVSAEINLSDKRIYLNFDKFNKTLSETYSFAIFDNNDGLECETTQNETCSIPFEKNFSNFEVRFKPYDGVASWTELIRINPVLKNRFTLLLPVGNCATALLNDNLHDVDPLLYDSCFCCGDKYNPDPSLKCPVSPWA